MPTVTGDNFYIDKHTLQFRTGESSIASIAYDKTQEEISISNAGTGSINIGDAGGDIFIGDGSIETDIVFEQNGSIRALANKTLKLGQSDSDVKVNAQNFIVSGDASFSGAMTINGNPVMTGASDLDTDTLQTVTDRGATTTNDITISNTAATLKLQDSDGTNQFSRIRHSAASLYFYSRNDTSNGNFLFYGSDGSDNTELMRIEGGGDVGIGTNNPSQTLHVKGIGMIEDASSTSYGTLQFGTDTSRYVRGNSAEIQFGSTIQQLHFQKTNGPAQVASSAADGVTAIQLLARNAHTSANLLEVVNGNGQTADFVIDSDGKVGIGTTNPTDFHSNANRLVVGDGAGAEGITIFSQNNNAGYLYFADGTAGDAAYRGFVQYSHSTNNLSLGTAGGTKLTIASDGSVGIGSTTPLQKLDVAGVIRSSVTSRIQADVYNNSANSANIIYRSSTSTTVGNNASALVILDGGNVGIGTTNPTQALEVHSTIKIGETAVAGGRLISADSMIFQIDCDNTSSTSSYRFRKDSTVDAGTELMRIQEDGNVGIGTANPDHKLHVKGDVTIDNESASDPSMLHFNATNKNNLDPTSRINFWEGNSHGNTYTDSNAFIEYNGSTAGGGDGYLALGGYTNAGANQDIMILNRLGRVGIGTTNPSAQLDVIYGSSKDGIFVKDEAGGAVTLLGADGSNNARARFYNGSHATVIELNANAGSATYFNAGNVGIGTTNPQTKLTVGSDGDEDGIELREAGNLKFKVRPSSSNAYLSLYDSTVNEDIRLNTNGDSWIGGGSLAVGMTDPSTSRVRIKGGTSDASTNALQCIDSSSAQLFYVRNDGVVGVDHNYFYASASAGAYVQHDLRVRGSISNDTGPLVVGNSNGTYIVGDVGIGVTNPARKLTLANGHFRLSDEYRVEWGGSDVRIDGSNASDFLRFYTADTERMRIDSAGKVGIGVTAPIKELQVDGSILGKNNGGYLQYDAQGNVATILNLTTANELSIGQASHVDSMSFNVGGGDDRIFINSAGNVGIGTTGPATTLDVDGLISSDQIRSKKYTSLSGSSNDWFPIGSINEHQTGPVLFQVITAYHSNMSFIVAKGYGPSQEHSITLLSSIDSNNTSYANIKGVRVRQDGQVEIQLYWTSGPSVVVNVTARSTTDPVSLPSSLATSTSSENIIDTVTNEDGKLRSRKLITTSSNVQLSDNGISYLNGGNVGMGTTNPARNLSVASSSTNALIQLANSTTSSNADNGLEIFISDTNAGIVNRENGYLRFDTSNIERVRIAAGGKVGIGTTNPAEKLHVHDGHIRMSDGYKIDWGGTNVRIDGDNSSDYFRIFTSSTERLRVDTDGNVALGNTSAGAKFEVRTDNNTTNNVAIRGESSTGAYFRLYHGGAIDTDGNITAARFIQDTNVGNNFYAIQLSRSSVNDSNPDIYGSDNGLVLGANASEDVLKLDTGNTVLVRGGSDPDTNSYKADFAVGVGTNPQISWRNQQVQIGGTDMNWAGKVFHDGTFQMAGWSSHMKFYTQSSSSSAYDIYFSPWNGSSVSEAMRILGEGRVGIGTNNPSVLLDVYNTGGWGNIDIDGTSGGELRFQKAGSTYLAIYASDTSSTSSVIKATDHLHIYSNADSDGSHSIYLNDAGNVGIGTSNVTQGKVEVYGNGADTELCIHEDAGSHQARLHLRRGGSDWEIINDNHLIIEGEGTERMRINVGDGNVGIGTSSVNDHARVTIQADNANVIATGLVINSYQSTTATAGNGVGIVMGQNNGVYSSKIANVWTNNNPSYLQTNIAFYTMHDSYTAGSETEKMRLTSQGRLGIGVTNPSAMLHVEGTMQVKGANGWAGTDTQGGSIYISTEGQAILGNMGANYARPMISSASNAITIGSNGTSAIRNIKYHAGNGAGAADSEHNFYTSGNNVRLHIAKDGNVGIGTDNPVYDLTIGGNAVGSTGGFRINDPSNVAYGAHFSFADTPNEVHIGGITNNVYNDAISINRESTRTITIDGSERVGIGTASPSNKLEVNGDVAITSKLIHHGDTDTFLEFTNNTITLDAGGEEHIKLEVGGVTINEGGQPNDFRIEGDTDTFLFFVDGSADKVGIGTSTPTALLDVDGTIKTKVHTIGALPSASPAGQRAMVSDSYYTFGSSSLGSTVYAGGSAVAPVYSDGSYWRYG